MTVSDAAGRAVWRSHPLAAGRDAEYADVRDGRRVGPGRGWSILPPDTYTVIVTPADPSAASPPANFPGSAGRTLEVTASLHIEARFGREEKDWMPPLVCWPPRRHLVADAQAMIPESCRLRP